MYPMILQCLMFSSTFVFAEIEAQVRALQANRAALSKDGEEEATSQVDPKVGLGQGGHFDTEIYDNPTSKFHGYVTSIATTDEVDVST